MVIVDEMFSIDLFLAARRARQQLTRIAGNVVASTSGHDERHHLHVSRSMLIVANKSRWRWPMTDECSSERSSVFREQDCGGACFKCLEDVGRVAGVGHVVVGH